MGDRHKIFGFFVIFGHDKRSELRFCEFMVKCSVTSLHSQDPVEFPTRFIEDIGGSVAGLRDIQIIAASLRKKQPGIKHMCNRNGSGTNIFTEITRIVPSAGNGL